MVNRVKQWTSKSIRRQVLRSLKESFPVEGGEWLAGDEGNMWILGAVDRIVEALGEGQGTSFAPGLKSKL